MVKQGEIRGSYVKNKKLKKDYYSKDIEEIIQSVYEKFKDYPEITKDVVRSVVAAQFKFIKTKMVEDVSLHEDTKIPTIRIQLLGRFIPFTDKAKNYRKKQRLKLKKQDDV